MLHCLFEVQTSCSLDFGKSCFGLSDYLEGIGCNSLHKTPRITNVTGSSCVALYENSGLQPKLFDGPRKRPSTRVVVGNEKKKESNTIPPFALIGLIRDCDSWWATFLLDLYKKVSRLFVFGKGVSFICGCVHLAITIQRQL